MDYTKLVDSIKQIFIDQDNYFFDKHVPEFTKDGKFLADYFNQLAVEPRGDNPPRFYHTFSPFDVISNKAPHHAVVFEAGEQLLNIEFDSYVSMRTAAMSAVVLLAPPVVASMQRVIEKIAKRPGAELNPEGTSKLPRTDGTTTLLPKEYIESLDAVDPLELYKKIANDKQTIIIRATEDQVLGMTSIDEVGAATLIDIPADHELYRGGTPEAH